MATEANSRGPIKTAAEDGTLLGIDASSWVSWASYYTGFVLAFSPRTEAALAQLGWQAALLAGAIAAFFVAILFIQRHMKFSLLANTYGTPARLVTDGVFGYSRNPIYVAFFMPVLSLAALSPIAAAAALAIYILAMNRFVIRALSIVRSNFFPGAACCADAAIGSRQNATIKMNDRIDFIGFLL